MHDNLADPDADQTTIDWLMAGDVSIQFQTARDLLDDPRPDLQTRIQTEGWGRRYLDCRNPDGTWGLAFYQPKWTSTHYTLLALKHLQMPKDTPGILDVIMRVLKSNIAGDGGLGTTPGLKKCDVCVNGMALNYASYFGVSGADLTTIIDYLLGVVMGDGGFNCMSTRSGARHSSLHSTLSVLEGIEEYRRAGHHYRIEDLLEVAAAAREFILLHRFYKSDHTGETIRPEFLRMPYPPRWRYNILRALDYFQSAKAPYDPRMDDALEQIRARRRADRTWPRQAALRGKVHFVMEPPRGASRWNTLIALRVLRAYGN